MRRGRSEAPLLQGAPAGSGVSRQSCGAVSPAAVHLCCREMRPCRENRMCRRCEMEGLPEKAVCLECGYLLRGLPSGRCPECGRSFDPTDPGTYGPRRRLGWLGKRWSVLPACALLYTLPLLAMYLAAPWWWNQFGLGALIGPLLLFTLTEEISGAVMLVLCVACMCAHPVWPRRWTAALTILGFLLWFLCARVADWMVRSV